MNEKIEALLPRQYAGRWTNEDGKKLFIVQYVEKGDNVLKKLFIPVEDYVALGVKKFLGKDVVLEIADDDSGRSSLIAIESE